MSELLSVILPAYNEEDCILQTIDDVSKYLTEQGITFEIIVVDDGSTDRTGELARQRNVRYVAHRKNYGVGAARKTGILNAKGMYVATTDVDGTYPNDQMGVLFKHLLENNCDMVVGARIGKNVVRELPHRWLPKFFIRKLASYMSQHSIPDLNSGLRVFRKEVALKYIYLLPDSHSWESTITLAFLCNKQYVKFLPIDYFARKGGKSSFAPIKDTYNYISLVIRTVMYFSPLRVFIPLSFLTIAIAIIKMIYDWNVYQKIGSLDAILFLSGILMILVGLIADLIVVSSRKLDLNRNVPS